MTEYEKKGKDRISELPESLLHEILSRISIKNVARTCILSKRWNYIWQKFPSLNFNEGFYFSHQGNNNRFSVAEVHWKNARLIKKAKQMVLSRCQEEDPTLLTLCWIIPKDRSWEHSNVQFIHNLAKTVLQELSIINDSKEYLQLSSSSLILPYSIKNLYFYKLEGLKSLLPYGTAKFKYLSTIELDDVVMVDDGVLVNGLNLVCPSLESLKILNCSGLENLHLTELQKLKTIILMHVSSLRILKIESLPHIEILHINFNNNLTDVDITNTYIVDSVRDLELHGNFLTQDLFDKVVCKCRFLEILDIGATKNLKTINISMDTIKMISIDVGDVEKLVEIELKTPLLEYFQLLGTVYNDPSTVLWKFPNPKIETMVVISLTANEYDWFHYIPNDDKLEVWQNFFGYFNHAKKLEVICPPQFLIWVKMKWRVSPFGCLKNIVYNNVLPESSPPILHLLESLIFLAPQATTMSFKNDVNAENISLILKIEYGEKEGRETTLSSSYSNYQSEFLGIDAWLLSVSKVIIEKYHGHEYDWKEFIQFFSKTKNLEFVLPQKENVTFSD